MKDQEILNLWKAQDEKLNKILSINKELVNDITKIKLSQTLGKMRWPKSIMIVVGIPYTIVLYFITFIAFMSNSVFVALGFGAIGLIMTFVIFYYMYQLHLINRIKHDDNIVHTQHKLSHLKITSFKCTKLSIMQLPFWCICWISWSAFLADPWVYGGVNLIIFLLFLFISIWLYKRLNVEYQDSKIHKLFFSGIEWEPILKSYEILDQLKEYQE